MWVWVLWGQHIVPTLCAGIRLPTRVWMWLVIKVDVIHLIADILLSTHILVETDIVSADNILSR